MNKWGYFVILGIGISGLASIVVTYDAITGLDKELQHDQSEDIKKRLRTRFIVILLLSIFALIIGIAIGYFLQKNYATKGRALAWGIGTVGVFGILWALSTRLLNASNTIKISMSYTAFAVFVLAGIFWHWDETTA